MRWANWWGLLQTGGTCLDFQLSDEQLQLKKMVRDFAEREIARHVRRS